MYIVFAQKFIVATGEDFHLWLRIRVGLPPCGSIFQVSVKIERIMSSLRRPEFSVADKKFEIEFRCSHPKCCRKKALKAKLC